MSKLMLVNRRSHKNLSSNVTKILLQQKVFCIALLSIACISCTHARAYQDRNISPINWANYIAPSPLDMSGDAYQQHDGANADDEHTDGEVEDTPMKGNKPDSVSNIYEELSEENGNDLDEVQSNNMGHASPMDNAAPARPKSPTNNVQQSPGKFDLSARELERFLSQFYLIRTPYGYILGRVNPAISTSSISRRSMQAPKSRMKSKFGVINLDSQETRKHRTPQTNFKLRVRRSPRDFQLRLRRNPNFQLRVRKQSPNFQLRVRKNPNFQLRVRKSDSRNAFQLRVRKDANNFYNDATKRLPRRNFQLRVRKSDPSYEELVPDASPITQDEQDESMTRYGRTPTGFQLRVRKAPTNFQLRVRKDDPAFKNSMDEKRDYTDYLDYLTETDLSDYANSLPEIHLPGILKLARKRNVGNFQLRV